MTPASSVNHPSAGRGSSPITTLFTTMSGRTCGLSSALQNILFRDGSHPWSWSRFGEVPSPCRRAAAAPGRERHERHEDHAGRLWGGNFFHSKIKGTKCPFDFRHHVDDARSHAPGGANHRPEGRVHERNVVGIVTRGGGIEVTLSLLSPRRHAAGSVFKVQFEPWASPSSPRCRPPSSP
jgi:hypothetical protein